MTEICAECKPRPKIVYWDSPLQTAVNLNHIQCAEILVRNGWDVNTLAFGCRWYYIQSAAYDGYEKLVKFFIQNDASIDVKCIYGTPFCMAMRNGHFECVEILLNHGAKTEICCEKHKNMTNIFNLCCARNVTRINQQSCLRKIPIELTRIIHSMIV
jgi:hypothetical protein